MKIWARSRKCLLIAIAIAACSGSAFASSIVQTINFSGPVDVTSAQTAGSFFYFQSAGAPAGAILDSVDISVSLNVAVTSLDITNLDTTQLAATAQSFSYLTYTGIDIFSPAGTGPAVPTGDFNNLVSGLITPGSGGINLFSIGSGVSIGAGSQAIGANQIYAYIGGCSGVTVPNNATCYVPGAGSPIDSSLIGAGSTGGNNGQGGSNDINPYNFANAIVAASASAYNTTGTFQFSYDTNTALGLSSSGGNIGFHQTTQTTGSFTVTYNYEMPTSGVPEPGTWVLMSTALLGIGAFRKRLFVRP